MINTVKALAAAGRGRFVVLLGLLVCAAVLNFSEAGSAANGDPVSDLSGDEVADKYGFVWARGNVSTANWSAQKSGEANFTVRRPDGVIFRALSTEDIEARLDGKPLALAPGSLIPRKESAPTSTLFMIDCSKSMSIGGVDKLQASKDALSHFVGQLGDNDKAAIYSFADLKYENVPLTNDRKKLQAGIITITTCADDKYTNLYEAIQEMLGKAERNSVIVLLSDGMEDNSEVRAIQDDDKRSGWVTDNLRNHKNGWEQKLRTRARDAGVRIFSIALGQPLIDRHLKLGSMESLKYVDFESLENISKETNGGFARLIDIAKLNENPANRQAYLTEKLKDVLVEIKKSYAFAYALPVNLAELREGNGELQLDITVTRGDEKITRSLTWTYTWDKVSAPSISPGRVMESFINTRPFVGLGDLARIYVLLLLPLALLGLLPSVSNRASAAWDRRRIRLAITVVGRNSPLRGRLCPNEEGPGAGRHLFREGDVLLICPKCKTPHHLRCWEYNQHQCMSRACEHTSVVPPEVMDRYGIASKKQTFA